MQNPDGTATCDRCGRALPGYGVLHGMISSHLEQGLVRNLIVCYQPCRPQVLVGLTITTAAPTVGVATALIAFDLDPAGGGVRRLTFPYADGSAAAYLARLATT